MKPLLNSSPIVVAMLLAGIGAPAISTAAIAAPSRAAETPATILVAFSARDLASPAGQAKVRSNIIWAATAVCAGDEGASPAPPPVDRQCYQAAVGSSLGQLDRAIAQAGKGPSASMAVALRR